jgi:hypothetical protein
MVYIAPTSSDGSGNVWVKLAEEGYDASTKLWAVDNLITNKGIHSFTLPSTLADGDYLIRGEIIALHEADAAYNVNPARGAQFYMECVQITVTGGGSTTLPTGVAIPGAYTYSDPGVLFNLYGSFTSYTIPGPAVWDGTSTGSSSGSSSSAVASVAASSALVKSSSVVASSSEGIYSVATSALAQTQAVSIPLSRLSFQYQTNTPTPGRHNLFSRRYRLIYSSCRRLIHQVRLQGQDYFRRGRSRVFYTSLVRVSLQSQDHFRRGRGRVFYNTRLAQVSLQRRGHFRRGRSRVSCTRLIQVSLQSQDHLRRSRSRVFCTHLIQVCMQSQDDAPNRRQVLNCY